MVETPVHIEDSVTRPNWRRMRLDNIAGRIVGMGIRGSQLSLLVFGGYGIVNGLIEGATAISGDASTLLGFYPNAILLKSHFLEREFQRSLTDFLALQDARNAMLFFAGFKVAAGAAYIGL